MARGVPEHGLPPGHSFDPAIPDAQFDRIGRVAVAWSHLEATLDDLIWDFLDLCDQDGRIITTGLDARPKFEIINKLAERYFSGDQLETLRATLQTIEDLRLDRNFIVHGIWGSIAPAKRLAAALSFRPKAPPGQVVLETFPPIRMKSIADGIDHARFQIVELTRQLQPLRQRSHKQPLPPTANHLPSPPRKRHRTRGDRR
jgi:hypothetical protein